ncbi:MAG: PIN domain-containing protein [Candidatus Beckwithbacteria bacterium]|nr:PIN domain-containing protein [Patescibacteria group bacterium]
MKLFIDADAFVGTYIPQDAHYQKCLKLILKIHQSKAVVYTSNTSFYEAVTVISQKAGKDKAKLFLKKSLKGVKVIYIDSFLEAKAQQIFSRQTSKNVSFFDCINMAIMEKLKIKYIFSFDLHYKKNGFFRYGID